MSDSIKYYLKTAASVLGVVILIAGAIVAAEDRYVTDKEAASSLQMFNQKVEYQIIDIRNTMIRKELGYINEEYARVKSSLIQEPNSFELKLQLDELRAKKEQLTGELR